MFYLNTDRPFIINSEIIEWDIKAANVSIIKEYGLLNEEKISHLEKMSKKDRVVAVGKEMRRDKTFSKNLENAFDEVVNIFITNNKLDIDYDIISIKRDAVFVANKPIDEQTIGKHIKFIPKNTYKSFLYLKPYEFYFAYDKIDVKGLGKENVPKHEKGILTLLRDIIYIAETSNMDYKKINRYLSDFVHAYKARELEFDYYREFNFGSIYRYVNYGNEMLMDSIDETFLSNLDIQYNYVNIVIPLIQTINY